MNHYCVFLGWNKQVFFLDQPGHTLELTVFYSIAVGINAHFQTISRHSNKVRGGKSQRGRGVGAVMWCSMPSQGPSFDGMNDLGDWEQENQQHNVGTMWCRQRRRRHHIVPTLCERLSKLHHKPHWCSKANPAPKSDTPAHYCPGAGRTPLESAGPGSHQLVAITDVIPFYGCLDTLTIHRGRQFRRWSSTALHRGRMNERTDGQGGIDSVEVSPRLTIRII